MLEQRGSCIRRNTRAAGVSESSVSRGQPKGLAVIVRWEGELVAQHHLLVGQQITIGSDRAADLHVTRGAIRRFQPLLQAGTNGYHILLPPGSRAVCRPTSLCPAGGYRTPERRVFEAGEHVGDELSLCFRFDAQASITVGGWSISVRPTTESPSWAAHSPEVVTQGFRQSLAWHHDRQAQLARRMDGASRGRCWPFVLLSGGLHLVVLGLVLAVPPDTCGCGGFYQIFSSVVVKTVIPRDWRARPVTIRASVDLDAQIGARVEPPVVRELRKRLNAALDLHRGFLRTCFSGRSPPAHVAVLLKINVRGRVTRSEVLWPWMPVASMVCMQAAMRRWKLPAYRLPLELKTRLDLVPRSDQKVSSLTLDIASTS